MLYGDQIAPSAPVSVRKPGATNCAQRIEYEILDCALNQANHSEGHYTAVIMCMRVRAILAMPGVEI